MTITEPLAIIDAPLRFEETNRRWLRLDANECIGAESLPALRSDRMPPSPERYPDVRRLERAIAERQGIDPARVVATAGADDAIDRIAAACLRPGSSVLVAEPTFGMIGRFATARGASVSSVPWMTGRFPINRFVEAAEGCDLIALVSPNNPTGLSIDVERLMAFRMVVPDPVLLIDLAYIEFGCDAVGIPVDEVMDLLRWMPRTILVRTLSKAWGLAGKRIGWAETGPDDASRIRSAGGPFAIAADSIESGCLVLRDEDSDVEVSRRTRCVAVHREDIRRILEENGLDAGDSVANFLLVSDPGNGGRADWLADGLGGFDIAVRRFEERCLDRRVRITVPVGSVQQQRLVSSISTVLDPEAILFDLDGVLADVRDSYRATIRRTVEAFGGDVDDSDIDRIKRQGNANDDWEVTRRLLVECGIEVPISVIVDRFQRIYLGSADGDGLRESERSFLDVRRLRRAIGTRMIGVVTGRPRAEAEWFLRRSGLDSIVDLLVAREDAPLKPDPTGIEQAMRDLDVTDAWFFGDTVDDVRAARNVGSGRVLPIGVDPRGGVGTDLDPVRELIDAGAARVVRAGRDTIDFIEENLS